LLLISLVIDGIITAFGDLLNTWVPFASIMLRVTNATVSFVLTTLLFGSMYKILSVNQVQTRVAIKGAVVTAILFQIGKVLIGLYLGTTGAGSSLGAAGALILLLFWIYYSALIVFFGAALTRALSKHEPL
jgi:membrane protein